VLLNHHELEQLLLDCNNVQPLFGSNNMEPLLGYNDVEPLIGSSDQDLMASASNIEWQIDANTSHFLMGVADKEQLSMSRGEEQPQGAYSVFELDGY
jgi:hypothetical protein